MDNNNCDNSYELYARHHAQRDTPASDDARAGNDVTDDASRNNNDFVPPATISIISDTHRNSLTSTTTAPPPPPTTTTTATQARPPSIRFKLSRKRSTADSDATDRSDASGKTATNHRNKGRTTLTSSFLRRKRIEYAGTFVIYEAQAFHLCFVKDFVHFVQAIGCVHNIYVSNE